MAHFLQVFVGQNPVSVEWDRISVVKSEIRATCGWVPSVCWNYGLDFVLPKSVQEVKYDAIALWEKDRSELAMVLSSQGQSTRPVDIVWLLSQGHKHGMATAIVIGEDCGFLVLPLILIIDHDRAHEIHQVHFGILTFSTDIRIPFAQVACLAIAPHICTKSGVDVRSTLPRFNVIVPESTESDFLGTIWSCTYFLSFARVVAACEKAAAAGL